LRVGGRNLSGITSEDSHDKLKEARALFEQNRETFYEGHREGIDALTGSEGDDQSRQLDAAIEKERLALDLMGEAIELQREAVAGQQGGSDGAGDTRSTTDREDDDGKPPAL
jgi:hypothetical protein